jgi:lincosamide nucleotidyltransferase A/C/D/E
MVFSPLARPVRRFRSGLPVQGVPTAQEELRISSEKGKGHLRSREDRVSEKQSSRWPRQQAIRIGRKIYPAIYGSWLGWILRLPPVERIKYRIIYTPASKVLAVMDELAAAQVRGWLAGGWGVDALVGRQTRPHNDIDLVIGDDEPPFQQIGQALAREGFWFVGAVHHPGIPIPWCHMWRHHAGHKVEVLPVPLYKPPFAADGADVGGVRQPFTEGSIDGQPVPCLSAELQLLLHNGYPQREADNHDVALLRAYLASRKK